MMVPAVVSGKSAVDIGKVECGPDVVLVSEVETGDKVNIGPDVLMVSLLVSERAVADTGEAKTV